MEGFECPPIYLPLSGSNSVTQDMHNTSTTTSALNLFQLELALVKGYELNVAIGLATEFLNWTSWLAFDPNKGFIMFLWNPTATIIEYPLRDVAIDLYEEESTITMLHEKKDCLKLKILDLDTLKNCYSIFCNCVSGGKHKNY